MYVIHFSFFMIIIFTLHIWIRYVFQSKNAWIFFSLTCVILFSWVFVVVVFFSEILYCLKVSKNELLCSGRPSQSVNLVPVCVTGIKMLHSYHHDTYGNIVNTIKTSGHSSLEKYAYHFIRGARGGMVIVIGIGHGDTSSNTGWDWMHFT